MDVRHITCLKGISDKRAGLFAKLGVFTIEDLVNFYPRAYTDYETPVSIADVPHGEYASIVAEVAAKKKPIIRPNVSLFRVTCRDADGTMFDCVFFNSEYSYNQLFVGRSYRFYGKVADNGYGKELNAPKFIGDEDDTPLLVPRYSQTEGLSSNVISACVVNALASYTAEETLTADVQEKYGLVGRNDAVNGIHHPKNKAALEDYRKRLAFDESLTMSLGISTLKYVRRSLAGAVMKDVDMSPFFQNLPFQPTDAQRRAVADCTEDMKRRVPMNRLLQGDVGSGKTLVAAAACFFAAKNGYQSAVMAPTEILARQHLRTFTEFLQPLGVNVELLTGSTTAKERAALLSRVSAGETSVLVGTHALIKGNISYHSLGLTIADEQHRFGVAQRGSLAKKGDEPHVLLMSATPIPRTLALIIYGDLDISILDEMPKGRLPVETYAVNSTFRPRLYNFIRKHHESGGQTYIVCPTIEESKTDLESVLPYFRNLKENVFPDLKSGLLHGKMKAAEKDEVMTAWISGEIAVLVSTTVVEVGVDNPNAVIMLIENAERFGLSQLHQLRGRVGRGARQSYCALISDSDSKVAVTRLKAMEKTSDGFDIANEDLKLRGPGDFFGEKQHGLPELKCAAMSSLEVLDQTRELAEEILAVDPKLEREEHELLRVAVNRLFSPEGAGIA